MWAGNLPDENHLVFPPLAWGAGNMSASFSCSSILQCRFSFLLFRYIKRDVTRLVWIASWMLIAHYIDLYWHIEPSFSETFKLTLADLVIRFRDGRDLDVVFLAAT